MIYEFEAFYPIHETELFIDEGTLMRELILFCNLYLRSSVGVEADCNYGFNDDKYIIWNNGLQIAKVTMLARQVKENE